VRAALLLAAGASRRFGRHDKLLAPLRGRPLIDHALDAALATDAVRVLAVVPSPGGRLARHLRGRGATLVVARDHACGLGASLAAGLRAVRPCEREVAILLGDVPGQRLPSRARIPAGHDALRPVAGGVPGHPLLVRTAAARAAVVTHDDQGLGRRLQRSRIALWDAGAGAALDIDTRAGLARARRRGRG